MKIILHIGPPKTGTTAIQGALHQNRETLLEAGALYFTDPTDTPRALATLYRNKKEFIPALRRNFWSPKQARAWSERAWERLAEQVETHAPRVLILSSEHFSALNLDVTAMLERLRTIGDDLHAIAYLRDPASLYCSFIDQQIRGGVRLDDLSPPWSYSYPPARRIGRWLEALGRDRMSVESFDRARLHDGDVVADFMQVLNGTLGLGLPGISVENRSNSSLSGAAAAMLLTMNETFLRGRKTGEDRKLLEHRFAIVQRLRKDPALAALPRLALPDAALKSTIRHNAREQLGWFNEAFFDGRPVMDTGTPGGPAPEPAAQRAFMKDWILGYLDDGPARAAAEVVLG